MSSAVENPALPPASGPQAGAPASIKELLALMKAWRGGRATRHLWSAIGNAYIGIVALAIIGAGLINLLIQTQRGASACGEAACVSARLVLPAGAFAAFVAVTAFVARMFGPVLASAAEGFWLLDSPVERRRILAPRLVAAVVVAGVIGAPLAALVALLTGAPVVSILGWALAGGLGCSAVVAFAAAQQGAERTWPVKLLQSLFALVAVVALGFVVAIAARWLPWSAPAMLDILGYVVAAVAVVVLVGSVVLAAARLWRIRRTRLTSGGALVSGMQGAMFGLDFPLMRDILVEREARERGFVKPRRGRGTGMQAIMLRDLQRLGRSPAPLAALLVSIVVPYAVDALGLGVLAPFVGGLVLCFSLVPFLQMLRVLTRTPGLARNFPFTTPTLRLATMAVPAALAALWALAVTPAFMGLGGIGQPRPLVTALTFAVVTGIAGLFGAVRWQSARQMNFNSPMLATSAGAFPPGMIANLFRGFDMVAIITAPLILGWTPWVSIALAGFVLIGLLGFLSPEMAEQQKAEQERLKAERQAAQSGKGGATAAPKQKIKVQR